MREIDASEITAAVKRLCQEANYYLPEDVGQALEEAVGAEESPTGKEILRQCLENARIAREEKVPLCQDTGFTVVFLEIGQGVRITGGDLREAVNLGVREGYTEGYLRKSIVADPLRRKNTGDNTPAMIHIEIVHGDRLTITVAPKGGGSENMSAMKMLTPADGEAGVQDFVVEWVKKAGANPCPPVVAGVGIGGTFEGVALLAKKALLRPLGSSHPDPFYARLEKELKEKINNLGVGPQGLGGRITCLGVHIKTYPCHIASLPVAVNLNCHVARHKSITI
ncbi:MAG: fumarate hydratase [Candidatus Aureabacteria bacterium]|nr:fumarate hydratase [Candidatus Auribacterota bacterium]